MDALVGLGDARPDGDSGLDANPEDDRDRPEDANRESGHQRCDIQHDSEIHADQKQPLHRHHALFDHLAGKPRFGDDRVEDVIGAFGVEVADVRRKRAVERPGSKGGFVLRGKPRLQPRDEKREGVSDRHHRGDTDEEEAEFKGNAEELVDRKEGF